MLRSCSLLFLHAHGRLLSITTVLFFFVPLGSFKLDLSKLVFFRALLLLSPLLLLANNPLLFFLAHTLLLLVLYEELFRTGQRTWVMRLDALVKSFTILLLTAVDRRGDVSGVPRWDAVLGLPEFDATLQERNLLLTLTANSDREADHVTAAPLKL